MIIRNPKSVRPWQHVLEPLCGYMLLAKKLHEGEKELCGAWNFGPKEKNYLTVQEIVEKTLKLFKKGPYLIKRDNEKPEADFLKLDINKTRKFLKWESALNFDKTLKLTLDWYRSFYSKENIIKITNQQIKSFFEKI